MLIIPIKLVTKENSLLRAMGLIPFLYRGIFLYSTDLIKLAKYGKCIT